MPKGWHTPPGTAQPACESPRRMTAVYLYGPGATRQQLEESIWGNVHATRTPYRSDHSHIADRRHRRPLRSRPGGGRTGSDGACTCGGAGVPGGAALLDYGFS
ncbi:MAG: hypothetical protein M0P33_03965 [Massilibacteroides sp.]|nr:hypothetical protein [Massilibacteroides sp.]